MISAVRNLAVSSETAAAKILAVASSATPQQRASIGTGLGQAAAACVSRKSVPRFVDPAGDGGSE